MCGRLLLLNYYCLMGRGPRLCGRLLVTAAQLLLFDRGEGLDCVAAYCCTITIV